MKNSIALLAPLGLLFAWSAPWTCAALVSPGSGPSDAGGTSHGGQYATDASVAAVPPLPDAGSIGIMAGPDGGVTVGSSALFDTDFVYASNWYDGTVSRVVIPADAGLAPFEQARYVSVIPVNNHQNNVFYPWTVWGQLGAGGGGGNNSPSRTVIDRKGNVVVALRAYNGAHQAGATRIINVGDHLNECHVRCNSRLGLLPGQHFTEGIPLNKTSGGTVELLPSPPPFPITGQQVLSDNVIGPGSIAATTYRCQDIGHDTTGLVATDPVNYDDCIDFSVALGRPNPDPDADPAHLTISAALPAGPLSFGRAAAISPNCAPASGECDTWIGMWTGQSWVHLANGGTPPLKLFDVQAVDTVGDNLYGGTVDCAGVLWGTHGACQHPGLTAVTTVPLQDPDAGLSLPADTVLTNFKGGTVTDGKDRIPDFSQCKGYGISSDTSERIWVAGGCGGNAHVCSFNAGALLSQYAYLLDAGVGAIAPGSAAGKVLEGAWQSYSWGAVGVGGSGRGVNVDKYNNVFQGMDSQGATAVSLNPDPDAGSYPGVPCVRAGPSSTCVDKNGVSTPGGGVLNWKHIDSTNTYGKNTIGVDLDAEGNLWTGQYTAGASGYGTAVRMNGQTGTLMASVNAGSGLYSYSDFTGYALREITLSSATFEQSMPGCGVSPELTQWTALSFRLSIPSGTDVRFDVSVTNATDAATLAAATTYPVCPSIAGGSCTTLDAAGNGVINLVPFNLPQGTFLNVYATLVPKICAIGGGGAAQSKPTLYNLGTSQICAGD